ncbi:hypothetical protein GCM10022244_29380 [Streptomyces gulbargensis]|uniref:Uncharacterized protein n=1 Tax=Streptomyces gulbargensis TaxID=364901 RepID=A0ABP7MDD4_9ACTN
MWQRDEANGHEGTVGVLLEDGTEPGPVYFDSASGSAFYESTDWWVYNGTLRAPTAERMRARCTCGWRGQNTYPIDWNRVQSHRPFAYDTSGPEADWETHMDDVAARTVPVPEDVARLLSQIRRQLEDIEDEQPLVALRIVGELEAIISSAGPYAARTATAEIPMPRIAEALGMTEKAALSRLYRYASPLRH